MGRRARRWTAVALVSVLALGACGDDDEEEEGAPAGGAATTTTLSPQNQAFCADVVTANTLEPDIPEELPEQEQMRRGQEFFQNEYMPVIKRIQATAPPAAKTAVDEITRFFEEKGPEAFEDDAIVAVALRANQAAAAACGADDTRVTAVNYAFQGMPATLEPGRRLFRLHNAGTELHEMIFLRKKATTTESFDQILALGAENQEAAEEKVDDAGGLFAFPAAAAGPDAVDSSTLLNLTPGQYAVVCFIPVGLTPAAAEAAQQTGQEPEGPPHFTRGMKTEFTVG